MNFFASSSAKYILLILVIFIIFVSVLGNAFNKLPEKNKAATEISEVQELEGAVKEEEVGENSEIYSETEEESSIGNENNNGTEGSPIEIVPDEELANAINAVDGLGENKAQETSKLEQANALLYSNYSDSIEAYKEVISTSEDVKEKASAYDGLAKAYALQKHYGSALSASQKAFNLEPNTSREMTLARLYYKTGDIDKATERVNNILRRDFLLNDK